MTLKHTALSLGLFAVLAALPVSGANIFIGNVLHGEVGQNSDIGIVLDIANGVDLDNDGTIDSTVDGNPAYDADGLVNGEILWSAANTYILNELVFIANGTLRIAAGTIIRGQPRTENVGANAGAEIYNPGALIISRTAKIIANGTSTAPIIMTTASTTGALEGGRFTGSGTFWDANPLTSPRSASVGGTWGGLIVLGNAPCAVDRNLSTTQALAVGIPVASYEANRIYFAEEFPGLAANGDDRSQVEGIPSSIDASTAGLDRFGGNFPNDNSGVLRFVSVRHGGANLASASEINGITLGGIGSGTVVENCEVWGNTDDGLEIFGGTVNVRNFLVVGSQDDSLDLDAGYTGTIQFFAAITGQNADEFAELDGTYENENVNGFTNTGSVPATLGPIPTYRIVNATFIRGAATNGNHSINIDDQASPEIVNSIVYNARTRHLRITSRSPENYTDTIVRFERNQARLQGVTFFGSPTVLADSAATSGTTLNVATSRVEAVLNSAGNLFQDPGFFITGASSSFTGMSIDPRPQDGAPVVAISGAGLEEVGYRGAFTDGLDNLWTTGWSAANRSGLLVD